MRNGILLVDKPVDFTSHDVVAKMRGILRMKKIGHAGTLDPMATGVLPLFLGPSTRACDRLPDQNKTYLATLKLGITTDTQDVTGTILETRPVNVKTADVEKALLEFQGEIKQVPPMYSAVQINGKRLYDLARQGKEIERPARDITIYSIELLDGDEENCEYHILVSCSKGTYIRTLCHDIGEKLGCGGTLANLRRTEASGFSIDDCLTLEQIETFVKNETIDEYILSADFAFRNYEKVVLDEVKSKQYLNGVPLWLNQLNLVPNNQWLRLYGPDEIFLGIGKANVEKRQLSDQKQFAGEVSY